MEDIDATDDWDNSPLYLAALCGHHDLLNFLLSNGAAFDPASHDGQRAIYGALTLPIKLTLQNTHSNTDIAASPTLLHFLQNLFVGDQSPAADYRIHLCGLEFPVHKVWLV